MKHGITIYWKTKDAGLIDRIRKRFGISEGMTVNGENAAELRKYEADGFVELRNKSARP